MEELKPCQFCPFCGKQPVYQGLGSKNDKSDPIFECETKGCPIENYPLYMSEWNTRADALADKQAVIAKVLEPFEELRYELDDYGAFTAEGECGVKLQHLIAEAKKAGGVE